MGDQKTAIVQTIWTDTTKLAMWQNDIWKAISNEWTKKIYKDQIPESLKKREEEVAKKRVNTN